jgi:putative membrane protein
MGSQGSQQGQTSFSSHDKKFVKAAAEDSMAAIKIGQLAEQKTTNPNIKRFAQQQVQTHQSMHNQLQPIAQQSNVTLPTQLNSRDQKEYNRLSSLSGTQFDQDYTRWAAQSHQRALDAFQQESRSGQNAQLKTFASNSTPTIQRNLQMAQSLERGGGAAAAGHADGTTQQQQQQSDQQSQDQDHDQTQSKPY